MNAKETIEAALRGEGCLGKAADDEPVFVLRACDMFAPGTILSWSMHVERAARKRTPKSERARDEAYEMFDYQAVHGCKLPD